jgi:hypothetical protein
VVDRNGLLKERTKVNRYKITLITSYGDSEEREIEYDSDAQAAEYAQANAYGQRPRVYSSDGRLVHDSQTLQEQEPR